MENLDISALIIGSVLFGVAIALFKIGLRIRSIDESATYANNLKDEICQGPYVQHGMVTDQKGNLKPQSRVSSTYIDSVLK